MCLILLCWRTERTRVCGREGSKVDFDLYDGRIHRANDNLFTRSVCVTWAERRGRLLGRAHGTDEGRNFVTYAEHARAATAAAGEGAAKEEENAARAAEIKAFMLRTTLIWLGHQCSGLVRRLPAPPRSRCPTAHPPSPPCDLSLPLLQPTLSSINRNAVAVVGPTREAFSLLINTLVFTSIHSKVYVTWTWHWSYRLTASFNGWHSFELASPADLTGDEWRPVSLTLRCSSRSRVSFIRRP